MAAMALCGDPDLLVLDEPNANLDSEGSTALNSANEGMKAAGGSVIIMAFAGRAAAQTFCDNDPYAKAGVFENVSITAWKKVHPADD